MNTITRYFLVQRELVPRFILSSYVDRLLTLRMVLSLRL